MPFVLSLAVAVFAGKCFLFDKAAIESERESTVERDENRTSWYFSLKGRGCKGESRGKSAATSAGAVDALPECIESLLLLE